MTPMNLPKPFCGHMVVEAVREDTAEYMKKKIGLKEDMHLAKSGFTIATGSVQVDEETGAQKWVHDSNVKVPLKKATILEMSPDCYGEVYKRKYGEDVGRTPIVGDIVMFIPMQTYKLDPEGKYHLIADEDVFAYYKGKEND